MNKEFELFLENEKISPKQFYELEPQVFLEWQTHFEQLNVNSFRNQKRFLINKWRHKFIGIPKEK